MDRLIQVEREQLAAEMRREMDTLLGQVMDAVNAAQEGRLIQDSERPVLELMRDFQQRVYEKALQLRIDSTESAFSPSEGCQRQAQAQQGPGGELTSDAAGASGPAPHAVLRSGRRKRSTGGRPGGSRTADDQPGGGGTGLPAGD